MHAGDVLSDASQVVMKSKLLELASKLGTRLEDSDFNT
jgi:hypothetical protein